MTLAYDFVIESPRLCLRRLTTEDAAFMLELLNELPFMQYVGDKGVRSLEEAREFITTGPVASYNEHGHGLFLIELKSGNPIGICGLLKRDSLDDPDLGYALLQAHWSHGYAREAALCTVKWAFSALGLSRIIALAAPENTASIKLLMKIGFRYEQTVEFRGVSNLYALERGAN